MIVYVSAVVHDGLMDIEEDEGTEIIQRRMEGEV